MGVEEDEGVDARGHDDVVVEVPRLEDVDALHCADDEALEGLDDGSETQKDRVRNKKDLL